MRLKSLYIKGFKSFANETVLHFNDDVIGVVGPNGSGKSNIVDAIRWVLGEQKSRELRLESMTDVIFNGTKTRKEAPTAFVELTFENDKHIIGTEYSTVSIARTLYRSGESEYLLNKVPCRLKDITSLFLDTGIGSNSYAIIALGMVDDILADKDNARRKMFEQAAGISKYKKRKRETLNKLKSNEGDLNRINDLLFEIEGNMKSLEKQAKRTKKYFEIKDQYKEFSINLASRSIQTLKEEYKVINEQVSSQQDIYQQLQATYNAKEAQLEQEKKNNLDKEIAVSQKQKELNALISKLRSAENEKELLEQKIEFKQSNIKSAKSNLNELKVSLDATSKDLNHLEKVVQEEKQRALVFKEDLELTKSKYESVKERQNEAKQLNDAKVSEQKALQDSIFNLDKELAIIANNIANLENESVQIKNQIQEDAVQSAKWIRDEKSITKQVQLKEKELNLVKSQEEERIEKIKKLENQRDEIQDGINKINRLLDSKQNEYDLLKSMVENYEGFPESIKYLSNNWRKDVPILSDLLDVQEEYKSVIEQYLEPYLNYYVVHDTVNATEAIKLLRGAQKGKANFFLLNQLPKVEISSDKVARAIPAADVVHVEMAYQGLLNYLLKDAYIFEGEVEEFILGDYGEDKIFLSNVGSFIKTKTTLSGGSLGLFEGKKIGRRKNLEKIEKLLSKNEVLKTRELQKLDAVKAELQHTKQASNNKKIDQVNNELNTILRDKVRLAALVENLNKIEGERKLKLQGNLSKGKSYQTRLKEIENEKSQFNAQLDELLKGGENQEENLDSLTEELRQASEVYNSANIALIKHQNIVQNSVKDLDFKMSKVNELEKNIKLTNSKIELDQQELLSSREKLTLLTRKLQEYYEAKTGYQGNLNAVEQEYYEARNTIVGLEEEIKRYNRNLNQKTSEINNLKDKFNDVRFKISAVGERLKIEFEININDIINEEVDVTMPLEELEQKVERLKSRLSNYGEINPMALEAYEEIKQRHEHITIQRQDILDAQVSLLSTIKEIENTATEKFMESFDQVRENFILVFRSLFTEDDNCDLILLDPDNPLESGIEIIAKPKGKKPKSLSQLSGGEKTLTATALLFALYLLKPAPFCIFDEVDAPLDDANIQKFNKIIKKFSSESQFIIVTHNKATMSAVDVLYGVYMQEMGVSGVAPVDFRSLKEQPLFETTDN